MTFGVASGSGEAPDRRGSGLWAATRRQGKAWCHGCSPWMFPPEYLQTTAPKGVPPAPPLPPHPLLHAFHPLPSARERGQVPSLRMAGEGHVQAIPFSEKSFLLATPHHQRKPSPPLLPHHCRPGYDPFHHPPLILNGHPLRTVPSHPYPALLARPGAIPPG